MRILFFANTDWYLYNFRRSLALAVKSRGHTVLLVSPPGKYGEQLRAMGFEWIPAPMDRRSLNPLRELMLIVWLARLIWKEHVDVIHGFTIKAAVYGALAARMAGVTRRVASITGLGYVFTSDDTRARVLRPIVKFLMRLALGGEQARLILQNADDVQLFGQSGWVDASHVVLIPGSGVDCCRFTAELRKQDTPTLAMRVLLPARLLWDKGVAEYVAAARELRRSGRNIEFLLAGMPDPGNPSAVPEEVIRHWEEEGVVRWLGHVEDMPALFHAVDVVVLPSYREGLPKGLIEAAACELPLVTTRVPGCREVVDDGVNGLLVPVKDPQALARAIARLHDDAHLRVAMGHAARERVLERYDEQIIIKKTLDVYEQLLPA